MPSQRALIYVPALSRDLPLLLTVEEAGELAGWSRDFAYRAAKPDGILPVLRQGSRLLVPTATWLEQLGLLTQRATAS